MKKILHVIDSLGLGGAERLLVGIINGLTDFENHLMILHEPTLLQSQITNLAGFYNLECQSFKHVLSKARKASQIIKSGNFDIVHSHLYESNILSRLATPSQVALYNSIHSVSSKSSYQDSKASLWLEKLTYRKRHHLIHVSQTVADDFKSHVGVKGKSTVLYNYIDDVYFDNTPKSAFDFGGLKLVAVGNLRYEKNYPYLIEAFKSMPENITLDVYGDGLLRESLQKEIDRHGVKIRLLGLKHNIHEILPRYDVFVMSSFFEGQPVALLEAMATGLPALISDIPVLREVGGSSVLYFDINDPLSFVARVKEIESGKYNLTELSEKGQQFTREHARKSFYISTLKSLYAK